MFTEQPSRSTRPAEGGGISNIGSAAPCTSPKKMHGGGAIPYISDDPALYDMLHSLQNELDESLHHAIAGNHGRADGSCARARRIIEDIAMHRNAVWGRKQGECDANAELTGRASAACEGPR